MINKPIILFDGVCNLCNSSIQFILKHEKSKYFYFASLQSDFGQKLLEQNNLNKTEYHSIILLENRKLYFKSKAALKIAKRLKFPFNSISIFSFIPSKIRDLVYDFISQNRYKWFGKRNSCYLPSKKLLERFISDF